MNNFSTFFFLALASLTSLVVTGQDVAIGVKFNGGYPVGDGSCSTDEYIAIQEAFNSAVEDANRRNLRAEISSSHRQLDLFQCTSYCQGFPPGWCYLAYRGCKRLRMLLLEEGEQQESPEELELFLLDKTAALRDLTASNSNAAKQCKATEKAVVKAVKKELDWGSLTRSCKKVLREKVDLECFHP